VESEEVFQLSISFGHLTVFGDVLLQELAFSFSIHRFLFIGEVASLFIKL